jgi:hypothetical protein
LFIAVRRSISLALRLLFCLPTAALSLALAFAGGFDVKSQSGARLPVQLGPHGIDFPFVQAAIAVLIEFAENAFAQGRATWFVAAFALVFLSRCDGRQGEQCAHENCT